MMSMRYSLLALSLLAGLSPLPVTAHDGPMKYMVDDAALYTAGIARGGRSYPNKCFHRQDFSLSDEFLSHYTARGFSLPALCFAVGSSWVQYDPESGRPLRTLHYSKAEYGYLIDVPDCFKNGTPFLDCAQNYHYEGGRRLTQEESDAFRQSGEEVDRTIRELLAAGKFSRYCTCDDLEIVNDPDGHPYLQIKGGGGKHGQPVGERYTCRLKDPPECAHHVLRGRNLKDWRLYEVASGYDFVGTPLAGGTQYGPFEISPLLPRGYAYQIGHPEGDDDSPFLELLPGTKLNVAE